MPLRTKAQIALTLFAAAASVFFAAGVGTRDWVTFCLLLTAALLSSGFKIALPRGDGSMTLNFPFILLGIVQLPPLQVMLLAGLSVAAQCRVRVSRIFTAVQIGFNVANTMLATVMAFLTYAWLHHHQVGTAPALASASVAYFAWSTITVAMVLASTKGENGFQLWRREFPWYLPFYMVGAVLAALANYIGARFGWGTALLLMPFVYTLYRAYMSQVSRLKERQQHLEETEALHMRTIEGLAMAIEAKDQGTHDHLFRVRHYVKAVGEAMHLSKVDMQALETSAFLHDIGKLAVSEQIINKPGKLTPEEFEKMKIHPVVGADILERVRFPYPVVPIVRSHHEWWNGTGYPDGLRGTDIPLGARILTVIDCFDALVSDRPYRKGIPEAKAFDMIKSLRGKQFDPQVVQAFEKCFAEANIRSAAANAGFTALNTEVEVWRGMAPGAGYETGSHENAPSKLQPAPAPDTSPAQQAADGTANLVASASQAAQDLFELSQTLGSALTRDETLSVISMRLRRLVPYEVFALYLRKGDTLELSFQDGPRGKRFTPGPVNMGEGVTGWAVQNSKPLLNGNAAVEPGCPLDADGAPALRSGLAVPLFDLHREIFAVLTLYTAANEAFTRNHLRTLLTMEPKLSLALMNLRRADPPAIDCETDFLTGLPNARRLFVQLESDLAHAERNNSQLTLVVADLNSFRDINDSRGHLAANRLLRLVAEGLRHTFSDSALTARVGGDEFAFILPNVGEAGSESSCAAVRQAIASAARRAGQGFQLSASVGAASFPADGVMAEDLLAAANRRMYADKQAFYSVGTALSVRTSAAAPVACNS